MEKSIWANGYEFILVEAESLSLEDDFMKFEPQTDREKATKELISEAIHNGVKNFYRPKCDPSFDEQEKICYQAGLEPAVNMTYGWWKTNAKKFCPDHISRLGTRLEYFAFLGVLVKKLVEEGKSVRWAWNAVCNDSHELGHYWNSEDALYDLEPTGSREICGYFDLVNTIKFLADDKEDSVFWLAGGSYVDNSSKHPIADFNCNFDYSFGAGWAVGWSVCEK